MGFTADDLPDQAGRTFVITGANSGIGFEAARALARRGARVVMACRDPGRASGALEQIRAESPTAVVETVALDLASLASVRACAAELEGRFSSIDVLVNNAGVMALPRRETADGFEMQFGTNHLGHFALTGLLLPRIEAAYAGRVVTLSSMAHKFGKMDFADPQGARSYARWGAYGQSKLANLLFMYELQRRLDRVGSRVRSVACHPGYAATNLQGAAPKMDGSAFMAGIMSVGNALFGQSAAAGAWPTLYAATGEDVNGGDYIGPCCMGEMRGAAVKVKARRTAKSEPDATTLWDLSERLTSVRFAFQASAAA